VFICATGGHDDNHADTQTNDIKAISAPRSMCGAQGNKRTNRRKINQRHAIIR